MEKGLHTFLREGSRHSVYYNPVNGNQSTVPRHSELDNIICNVICSQLNISPSLANKFDATGK